MFFCDKAFENSTTSQLESMYFCGRTTSPPISNSCFFLPHSRLSNCLAENSVTFSSYNIAIVAHSFTLTLMLLGWGKHPTYSTIAMIYFFFYSFLLYSLSHKQHAVTNCSNNYVITPTSAQHPNYFQCSRTTVFGA